MAIGVVALMVALPVGATEWTFSPRLNMHATYTDNVGLSPPGQERGDWIGQVNPGFFLSRSGTRLDAELDYAMRNRYYMHRSGRNRASHRVSGNGTLEAVRERFFVDFGVDRREQAPLFEEAVGIETDVGRQTRDVTRYQVSPYAVQRFGRLAQGTLRYSFDETRYHGNVGADNYRTYGWVGRLESGPRFQDVFWRGDYSHEAIRFTEGDRVDVTFERYSGTLGYHLTPRFRVFGTAGEERNDYPSVFADTEGSFWNAGFGWAPTRRTNVEATYGERFFGKTGSLDVSHRTRLTRWSLSYNETLSLGRRLELQEVVEITDPDTGEPIAEIPLFTETDQTYVQERLQGSGALDLGRSTYTLRAFGLRREFQFEPDQDHERYGGTLSWRWQPAPRTSTNVTTGWFRTEFDELAMQEQAYDTWFTRVSISRELQPHMRAALAYRHQTRDSDEGAQNYTENAITASVFIEL